MQSLSILWIERRAMQEITAEANRSYPNETGGVLVGYVANQNQRVVLEVIGPGPSASHQRTRFEPDHSWQCGQLDIIYAQSSGGLSYLGDWHTHPSGVPRMSRLDRRTLRTISRHFAGQAFRPIMLIGGGNADNWNWASYQFSDDRFWGMSIQCLELAVRLFESEDG